MEKNEEPDQEIIDEILSRLENKNVTQKDIREEIEKKNKKVTKPKKLMGIKDFKSIVTKTIPKKSIFRSGFRLKTPVREQPRLKERLKGDVALFQGITRDFAPGKEEVTESFLERDFFGNPNRNTERDFFGDQKNKVLLNSDLNSDKKRLI